MTKVGEIIFSFIPNCLAISFTIVVLPVPKSPESDITVALSFFPELAFLIISLTICILLSSFSLFFEN